MVKRLNMGFIGMGFIGPVHADAVALNRDIAVPYAVADDDKAKHEAAKAQGLKVYANAMDLIRDPEVDAVHITGPDRFHAEWAIAAMDVGKKVVVCEKPMTETLDDAVRVLERAIDFENAGNVFMTNINYMGHALPRAARQMVAKGDIGEVTLVFGRYEQDWLMNPNVWNWRVTGDHCASKDILPHLISAAYFMGQVFPTSVIADSSVIVPVRYKPKEGRGDAFGGDKSGETESVDVKSDLYTSVLCDFNNGAKGNFIVTQYVAGRQNYWDIMIAGTERSLTWNQTDPNKMEIGQRTASGDGRRTIGEIGNITLINNPGNLTALGFLDAAQYSPYPGEHPAGHIDAFARNFHAAYQLALGIKSRGQVVIPGASIGYMCVAVADAVFRSMKSDVREKVDYRGFDFNINAL